MGQHGDTRAQLQDVLRLEHRQGGGLHQHHEEAVRQLSRHVSQVINTVYSEPLIGLQGVPEKTLSQQKAYSSGLKAAIGPRGSSKIHRFTFFFHLSPKSLGFCTCNKEKIALEESYPKTKFETRERFFWDTLYGTGI